MSRRDNPLEYTPSGEPYLGSRIRELRQARGWRLEEMARLISYHPGSLSKVENNAARPSDRMVQRIAELLEVPAEELRRASVHPRAAIDASRERLSARAGGGGGSRPAPSPAVAETRPGAFFASAAFAPPGAPPEGSPPPRAFGPAVPPPAMRPVSWDPDLRQPGLYPLGAAEAGYPYARHLEDHDSRIVELIRRVDALERRLLDTTGRLQQAREMIHQLLDWEVGRSLSETTEELHEVRSLLSRLVRGPGERAP